MSHDKTRPGYENFRKIAEQVAAGNSSLFRTKMTSDAVDELIEDITACMCGVYEQGLEREVQTTRTASMGARRDAFAECLDLCDQFDEADDVARGIRTLAQVSQPEPDDPEWPMDHTPKDGPPEPCGCGVITLDAAMESHTTEDGICHRRGEPCHWPQPETIEESHIFRAEGK